MDPIFIFLFLSTVLFFIYIYIKRLKKIEKPRHNKGSIPTFNYTLRVAKKVLTIDASVFEKKDLFILRNTINNIPHYQIPRKEIYFHLFKYDEIFSKEFLLFLLKFNELGIVTWENLYPTHKTDKEIIEGYSKSVENTLKGSTNLKDSEHLITFMLETRKINKSNVDKYLSVSYHSMNIFRKIALKNVCDFDYKELALITIKKNIKSFYALYHYEQDGILMCNDIYEAIVNKLNSLNYTNEKFKVWIRGKFSIKFSRAISSYVENNNIKFKH